MQSRNIRNPISRPRSPISSSGFKASLYHSLSALHPSYFLGLLAGSILTLFVKGGFGTLAGGRLETLVRPFALGAAGALATFRPGALGNPGTFGKPSTGALGNPPLVLGLLAALTLALFAVEEARGLGLTGGREDRGLELTGGKPDTEGFEGLGRPATEGEGLLTPETALFGFEAAETAVFLTAPAYEGVFAPRVFGLEGGAGRAFSAEEGAAGKAFCFAIAPAPFAGAGSAFCFFTAVGPEPAFGAVAAIARSP